MDSDLLKQWGQRIKAAREAKGLSQARLGQACNAAQASVSRWETGQVEPSAVEKLAIAAALDTAPDDLFPWEVAA